MAYDPQSDAFKKYIAGKKIVIADESAVARGSVANVLVQMGAASPNIALASTLHDATAEIARLKPDLVLCDFDLGKGAGLDLLQRQRAERPESKNTVFILVTGNTSQSAVARAAEEDVDTYILKPFTPAVLKQCIMKAVLAKARPDEYASAIEKGKELLAAGKIDEAAKEFEAAKGKNAAPSLACFYLGQSKVAAEQAQKDDRRDRRENPLEVAAGEYQQGLEYNKIHYKCMVGLFELYDRQKRHKEAYEVVKRVSQYFPANPARLAQVLRLAIVTKSYEDVERYYQVFTKFETRNEDVVRHVCAALVVCGKHYLKQNLKSRAIELFKKAAITAGGRTRILQEIILSLTGESLGKEAAEVLKRFPAETRSQAQFLAMELAVMNASDAPASLIIEKGRQMIAAKMQERIVYEILIARSAEAGLKAAADTLARDAAKLWPESAGKFTQLAGVETSRKVADKLGNK